MHWKHQFFAKKSLENLLAEMSGEHRLRRVLGPVSLTALGIGAIIGAGIFAITGRVARDDAGPGIMLSFVVAGIACGFAALCYSEFAALAPVAGSAYTYTYATLGEIWAWAIGWDLILEYAMSCAVVAAHWSGYLNEFLKATVGLEIRQELLTDPFSLCEINGKLLVVDGHYVHGWLNLPALLIMAVVTVILVVGIRESAVTNAVLVFVKLGVVFFVIVVGFKYVNQNKEHQNNWTEIPVTERRLTDVEDYFSHHADIAKMVPAGASREISNGEELVKQYPALEKAIPADDLEMFKKLPSEGGKWGLLGVLGIKHWLQPLDDRVRSPFLPYGLSGLMVGAALVFFAYIGFDSISTHSEEAKNPQRDVPLGILISLGVCTLLYILVSGVITGMEPYYDIDPKAAVASAFSKQAEASSKRADDFRMQAEAFTAQGEAIKARGEALKAQGEARSSGLLRSAAGLIAAGALAGMTSVLLVTFLSQARVFLAIARDGLLPHSIFGAVHPRFLTPYRSTILTGVIISLVAAFTPIKELETMVNIGTLMAFVLVCASVLILHLTRPDAKRPFRCPAIYLVAPLGIFVNLLLMLFLPIGTWIRLAVWLLVGMVIYLFYGRRHSVLGHELERQLKTQGLSPTNARLDA